MSEQSIEKKIKEKGLTAARITPSDIDSLMEGVTYWVTNIPDTTTTIAVAFDRNGFSLSSHISGCASPENFNKEIGEEIALAGAEEKAREELWKLEGYMLKRSL